MIVVTQPEASTVGSRSCPALTARVPALEQDVAAAAAFTPATCDDTFTPAAVNHTFTPEVRPAISATVMSAGLSTRSVTSSGRPTQPVTSNRRSVVPATITAGDVLLCQLAAIRDVLVLPMAQAAAALAAHDGWRAYGYATRTDFARERLSRDGRWLSDLVRLHDALERLPGLGHAVCGEDGGVPLGTVAALQIGRVATLETLAHWIARARSVPLASLRADIAAHLQRCASNSTVTDVSALEVGDSAETALEETDGGAHAAANVTAGSWNAGSEESDASDAPRVRLFCTVPADVKLAFEEALELHRNVAGRDAGPAEFVQALSGEASTVAWTPPDDFSPRVRPRHADISWGLRMNGAGNRGIGPERAPQAVPHPGHGAIHPGLSAEVRALYSPAMRRARQRLLEFDQLRRRLAFLEQKLARPPAAARGRIRDLRRLVRVLEALRRIEDVIEIDMGALLLEMHEHRAWGVLGFADLETYAEERLRMGGSTARKRVTLARQLRRLPVVAQAYADGKVGVEACQFIGSELRHEPADAAHQALCVEHAHKTTIRRLRSERRLRERQRLQALVALAESMTPDPRGQRQSPGARRSPVPGVGGGRDASDGGGRDTSDGDYDAGGAVRCVALAPPMPMDDATWRDSLRLVPGETHDAIARLGYGLLDRVVRGGPLMLQTLALDLPLDVAAEFLGCVEAARRDLAARDDTALTPGGDSRLPPSERIARTLVQSQQRVPDWVGVLALLEEWVRTHDTPEAASRQRSERILQRDGYSCQAPGCTSRANLQLHHIEHRAWGGGDEEENQLVLCYFHHMQGEHGGLARVRGRAPLDVVWRLGTQSLGVWFRNERRLVSGVRPALPAHRAATSRKAG